MQSAEDCLVSTAKGTGPVRPADFHQAMEPEEECFKKVREIALKHVCLGVSGVVFSHTLVAFALLSQA